MAQGAGQSGENASVMREDLVIDQSVDELVIHDQVSVMYGSEPADISINGELFLEDQEGAVAINVHDQNGNDVGSEVAGDWVVPIKETSGPTQTGTTVSGQTGDDGDTERGSLVNFWTLKHSNPFGHNKRFTGTSGGYYDENLSAWKDVNGDNTTEALAIPNDIVIDWAQWSQAGETVIAWRRSVTTVSSLANAITTAAGLTIGGLSIWVVPHLNEAMTIVRTGGRAGLDNGSPYDYPPISLSGTGIAERIWTITPSPGYSGEYILITDWNNRLITDDSSNQVNRKLLPMRYCTLTELGL